MKMIVPILVTLVGIVTDVSDVHESKASSPNDIEVLVTTSTMSNHHL